MLPCKTGTRQVRSPIYAKLGLFGVILKRPTGNVPFFNIF